MEKRKIGRDLEGGRRNFNALQTENHFRFWLVLSTSGQFHLFPNVFYLIQMGDKRKIHPRTGHEGSERG
jgi:hypothetical protein